MEEPSVLDYLKSKLAFWRKEKIEIPPEAIITNAHKISDTAIPGRKEKSRKVTSVPAYEERVAWWLTTLPFFTFAGLLFSIIAQRSLEPPRREITLGIVFYALAVIGLILAVLRKELDLVSIFDEKRYTGTIVFRPWLLGVGLVAAILAFLAFGDGVFTKTNVILWIIAVICTVGSFWQDNHNFSALYTQFKNFLNKNTWEFHFSRSFLLSVIILLIVLFFRLYLLNKVPPEMVSDHAEKLLDIGDVLNGQFNVFFPRNTGREGFQMYLTAAISLLFGTGLSFLSLKIGTTIAGLVTLIFIYLLGKEMGNRNVGIVATVFAGIAYWPNVISRIGLRFALYPLFVAPTLYFLLRGFKTSNRNHFVLAGIFLGLGLHGYSPFRIVPIVVVSAFLLFLVHPQARNKRSQALYWLVILILVSLVIFIPLFRYAVEHPDLFSYRILTRLGTLEKPLDAPAWKIFLSNLRNALLMFAWDNGEVWVVSVTHRPALSVVSSALFHLGIILIFIRYIRERNWMDAFFIALIPLLLLPSILSLAFPSENPILNRTAGAYVPVFVLIGIALESIMRSVMKRIGASWGKSVAYCLGALLFVFSAFQDYDLVFRQYQQNYFLSSWNSSEMGKVIEAFSEIFNKPDQAWVLAYPYWVDTRLVGVNAGYPLKDYAIGLDQIDQTIDVPTPKMFLVKPEDNEGLFRLKQLYPQGGIKEYTSQIEGKDFLIYFVPITETE